MVAFNFNERFIHAIESGHKTCTTRKTMRCKIGDKLSFYTGQRTKNCRKIGEGRCIGLAEIVVGRTDEWGNLIPWAFIGRIGATLPNLTSKGRQPALHERLGFMNVNEMVDFYRSHYGLPFYGFLHVWEPKECKQKGHHNE